MTYQKLLKEQMKRAATLGKEETAVKLLILELSGKDGATFLADIKQEIDKDLEDRLIEAIDEYLIKGRPVQHIIGYSYFYGYKMKVSEEVLIPRPETEELVIYTIKKAQQVFDPKEKLDYVDLGCGSGNILISIEKNAGFAWNSVTGVDISFLTLQATRKNKKYLGSAANLVKNDMISFLKKTTQKFDILTSNPPYISKVEDVDESVKKYEPKKALYVNPSYYYYEEIIKLLPKVMKEKFVASFEIGYDLKEILEDILKRTKFNIKIKYEFIKDIYGNDRILLIYSV